ncbi:universal stress protein [Pyxidicoccus sp. 3LFB2]
MAIVCATNLSPESVEATNVAAALAAKLGEPLLLLGVLDGEPPTDAASAPEAGARQLLEAECARLQPVGGTTGG